MIEPETDIEREIIKYCSKLAEVLIQKNREYGNSYSDSRSYFKKACENEKIPLIFHANEKINRYIACGSDDCILDLAGYAVLEGVCRRLENVNNL